MFLPVTTLGGPNLSFLEIFPQIPYLFPKGHWKGQVLGIVDHFYWKEYSEWWGSSLPCPTLD